MDMKASIGREHAKMTMAASIRKQMHRSYNDSDTVLHSVTLLPAGSIHETMNRSVGVAHHRVERAAEVPSDKKLDKQKSLGGPLAVKVEKAAGTLRKSLPSHVKLGRQAVLVAPLAVNMSQVTLKLVSHFCLFTVLCCHAFSTCMCELHCSS